MCSSRMMYSFPIKGNIIHKTRYTTNTHIVRRLLYCKKLESVLLYSSIYDLERVIVKIEECLFKL